LGNKTENVSTTTGTPGFRILNLEEGKESGKMQSDVEMTLRSGRAKIGAARRVMERKREEHKSEGIRFVVSLK
jgi:hypothetical protein